MYLQFLRFSERVLAEDFMFKDILIIGMMVYNCDCLEVAKDQEERQDTNRADVDHASISSLLIFDENRFLLNGRLSSWSLLAEIISIEMRIKTVKEHVINLMLWKNYFSLTSLIYLRYNSSSQFNINLIS